MSDILKNYPLDKVRIRNINKIKMKHPVSFEYIKKQGALEELLKIHKKLYQKGSTKESWHQTIDSFINKRVKELDGVKNKC